MKPFFVHVSRPVHKADNSKMRHLPRGFTAYVEPIEGDDRHVQLRLTFCAAAEKEFNKKVGRVVVMGANPEKINKRDLPIWIGAAESHINAAGKAGTYLYENQRMYLLKYVI